MKSEWKTGLKARTTADNFLKKSLSSNYFTYQQIFEMLVPLIMDQFFVSIIGLLTTAMISSSSQESVSAVSLVSPIYAMTYAKKSRRTDCNVYGYVSHLFFHSTFFFCGISYRCNVCGCGYLCQK